MAEIPPNSADLVAQFVSLTSVSPQVAQEYLASSSWDIQSAVTEFYNPPEEADEQTHLQPSSSARPQAIPTTSGMPPAPAPSQQPKKKFATLGDLGRGSAPGHEGHGHDDDDDDADDDPNLYAGGEKSGLAVENPDDLKKKIIERAKR
ncbi:MAG: hypothetical protein Q9164_006781, partial [Protoblastenia rupestris]